MQRRRVSLSHLALLGWTIESARPFHDSGQKWQASRCVGTGSLQDVCGGHDGNEADYSQSLPLAESFYQFYNRSKSYKVTSPLNHLTHLLNTCTKYQNFATASLLSTQPTDLRFENQITILWFDPEVLHFRPRTGQKWNKLRYTELFFAIFISSVIFSCTFDLKCHNEIKCTTVVRNLFQLQLSSTITLKSPYFELTGCAQFTISASMFAKSNTIFSGRQPRQSAKVL